MTWVRLDDKWNRHPKWFRIPKAIRRDAKLLWLEMITWCNCHLTDGHVPDEAVEELTPELSPTRRKNVTDSLVSAGFLEQKEGGDLFVHGYLEWNESRETVEARRAKTRTKVATWRKAKAKRNPVTHEVTADRCNPVTNPVSNPAPSPSPDPDPDPPYSPPVGDEFKLEASTEKKPSGKPHVASADIDRVLTHWAAKLWPGSKVKFTEERRKRVRARLLEGFTADDLCRAIDGATEDDWLMGRDPKSRPDGYRDVKTVLRDASQVERLVKLAGDQEPPVPVREERPEPAECELVSLDDFRQAFAAPRETPNA